MLTIADARHMPLADASVDAIVTDPPYELGFMGRDWDDSGVAFDPATWAEALRVAKPGAHLLAFGSPRTYPELAVAIRQAGWERRDTLMWLFGSGFPKSLDVSKAIDKAAGVERLSLSTNRADVMTGWSTQRCADCGRTLGSQSGNCQCPRSDAPVTDAARRWDGWGTALKPAYEPIVLARKPLTGTVAQNVLAHGTGALNIDGTRIAGGERPHVVSDRRSGANGTYGDGLGGSRQVESTSAARWPANLILDEEAAALLDASTGASTSAAGEQNYKRAETSGWVERGGSFTPGREWAAEGYGDSGGPSRFFYTSKSSRAEREAGLDDLDERLASVGNLDAAGRDPLNPNNYVGGSQKRVEAGLLATKHRRNDHPTVKPVDLMRWLVTLVTPRGGIVLDPFMGSGSTGVAALELGFNFIGFDLDPHYVEIARRRIAHERPMRFVF